MKAKGLSVPNRCAIASRPFSPLCSSSTAASSNVSSTGWRKHTPVARFGTGEEMVGAAIYLSSPSASYVTGETIIVDGGFMARGV